MIRSHIFQVGLLVLIMVTTIRVHQNEETVLKIEDITNIGSKHNEAQESYEQDSQNANECRNAEMETLDINLQPNTAWLTELQTSHIVSNHKFVIAFAAKLTKNNHDANDENRQKSSTSAPMIVRNNDVCINTDQTNKN